MKSGYLALTLRPDDAIIVTDASGRTVAEIAINTAKQDTPTRLVVRAPEDIRITRRHHAG